MDAAKLREYRERLLLEKKNNLELLHTLEEGLEQSLQDSVQELSSYDNHPADLGSEVFERGKDISLRENVRQHITKVDEALLRIKQGRYGVCDSCRQEIPDERLEALPETTLCIACRSKYEEVDRHPRPMEEDVLAPPWGGIFGDPVGAQDKVPYDGEDTWQELERFSEHAEHSGAGSYYGNNDLDLEDRGYVEEVENIPYYKEDGIFYEAMGGNEGDTGPDSSLDAGLER